MLQLCYFSIIHDICKIGKLGEIYMYFAHNVPFGGGGPLIYRLRKCFLKVKFRSGAQLVFCPQYSLKMQAQVGLYISVIGLHKLDFTSQL